MNTFLKWPISSQVYVSGNNLNFISLQGGLLMNVSCVFHLICFAPTKSDGGDLAIV